MSALSVTKLSLRRGSGQRSPTHSLLRGSGSVSTSVSYAPLASPVSSQPEPILSEEDQKAFGQLFKSFDVDGDGSVTAKELGAVMRSLGQDMSQDELRDMIADYDNDGSGCIELPEFLAMMSRTQSSGAGKLSRMRWSFVKRAMQRERDERAEMQESSGSSSASSDGETASAHMSRQNSAVKRRSSLRRICRELSDELKMQEARAREADEQRRKEQDREKRRRERRKTVADRELEARRRERQHRLQRSVRLAKLHDFERRRLAQQVLDTSVAAVAAALRIIAEARSDRDALWMEAGRLRRMEERRRRERDQWRRGDIHSRRRTQLIRLVQSELVRETLGREALEQEEQEMRVRATEQRRHFDTNRRRAEERDRRQLEEEALDPLPLGALLQPGADLTSPCGVHPRPFASKKVNAAWGVGCRIKAFNPEDLSEVLAKSELRWGTVQRADQEGVTVCFDGVGSTWLTHEAWCTVCSPVVFAYLEDTLAAAVAWAVAVLVTGGAETVLAAERQAAAAEAEARAKLAAAEQRITARREITPIWAVLGRARIAAACRDVHSRNQADMLDALVCRSRLMRTDWGGGMSSKQLVLRRKLASRPQSAPAGRRATEPPPRIQATAEDTPRPEEQRAPVWNSAGLARMMAANRARSPKRCSAPSPGLSLQSSPCKPVNILLSPATQIETEGATTVPRDQPRGSQPFGIFDGSFDTRAQQYLSLSIASGDDGYWSGRSSTAWSDSDAASSLLPSRRHSEWSPSGAPLHR